MNNKNAVLGEGVMMMYRMLLVSFIALVILGVSSVFYAHYIDVREAEAMILTKVVVDCISPEGVLDLDEISGKSVLDYCGFDEDEIERFYVGVFVYDEEGKGIGDLSQGDSGAKWVLDIYKKQQVASGIKKYEPGYFPWEYPVFVLSGGERINGTVKTEVLVNDEF